jgi:hypothetical protein
MHKPFSISKYYNAKLAFHAMARIFSSVIYCKDILARWVLGVQQCTSAEESQKWVWKQQEQ